MKAVRVRRAEDVRRVNGTGNHPGSVDDRQAHEIFAWPVFAAEHSEYRRPTIRPSDLERCCSAEKMKFRIMSLLHVCTCFDVHVRKNVIVVAMGFVLFISTRLVTTRPEPICRSNS